MAMVMRTWSRHRLVIGATAEFLLARLAAD
jgi:hypothetical protein